MTEEQPLRVFRPQSWWRQPVFWLLLAILLQALRESQSGLQQAVAVGVVGLAVTAYLVRLGRASISVYADQIVHQALFCQFVCRKGDGVLSLGRALYFDLLGEIGTIERSGSLLEIYRSESTIEYCWGKISARILVTEEDVSDELRAERRSKELAGLGPTLRSFAPRRVWPILELLLVAPIVLRFPFTSSGVPLLSGMLALHLVRKLRTMQPCRFGTDEVVVTNLHGEAEVLRRGEFKIWETLGALQYSTVDGRAGTISGSFEEHRLVVQCLKKLAAGQSLAPNDLWAHPVEIPAELR